MDYIGWWGKRPSNRSSHGPKWHLIESEVTDRLVMRCGRQMPLANGNGVIGFHQDPAGERCEQCVGTRVND